MTTCGTCQHGKLVVQDMTKRDCKGAPPQLVVLPAKGGVSVQIMYPRINASDEACGAYKAKQVAQVLNSENWPVDKDPIRGGELS